MIKLPDWINNIVDSLDVQEANNIEINILEKAQSYLLSIKTRILNWKTYPSNYMIIYECLGNFRLYHFRNTLLAHTQEVNLADYEWREYVTKHENLPIYLVLQAQDCEFRDLPTNQIRFWDRFFLFNQIVANEFSQDDFINHYRSKASPEKSDIFVSIRSNETLKQVLKILNSLRNPIAGVLSWDLEQTLAIKNHISANRLIRNWSVTLIPIDHANHTMLVMHQDKVLLQRIISTKKPGDLEKEIRSTLQFLQRQGYTNGQAVSILMSEDFADTYEFSNAELEILPAPKKFLEKEVFRPVKSFLNLLPKSLRQAYLAHELPRLGIKFLIPISAIVAILWASIQIKSFFQDYENKWIKVKYEETSKKLGVNADEQLHRSKLFAKYLKDNNNISTTISALTKIIRGKTQVLSVSWNAKENGREIIMRFPQAQKKAQDIRKYINQNCERLLENITLTWSEEGPEMILTIQQEVSQNDN